MMGIKRINVAYIKIPTPTLKILILEFKKTDKATYKQSRGYTLQRGMEWKKYVHRNQVEVAKSKCELKFADTLVLSSEFFIS